MKGSEGLVEMLDFLDNVFYSRAKAKANHIFVQTDFNYAATWRFIVNKSQETMHLYDSIVYNYYSLSSKTKVYELKVYLTFKILN